MKQVGFYFGAGVLLLLMLAVLELNKNTLWGFALLVGITVLFFLAHALAKSSVLRFACWIGWIALFVGVLLLT